ncbi:MAG: hypothetical protein U9P71_07760 [Campylobacterota bacterium]|nr:hypothetical protein [Campylobacterota bacterium]
MSTCAIDAEYRAEERYAKLSLAFTTDEEYQQINDVVIKETATLDTQPQLYTSNISKGRRVLVIEYHDDNNREIGQVFEMIMKKLNITMCD